MNTTFVLGLLTGFVVGVVLTGGFVTLAALSHAKIEMRKREAEVAESIRRQISTVLPLMDSRKALEREQ